MEPCPGECPIMRRALESQDLGHVLVLAVFEGRPSVCCVACGCYATTKIEGLSRPCLPARPGSKGVQAINRLFRGRHPDFKKSQLKGEAWFRVLRTTELQEFTPGG